MTTYERINYKPEGATRVKVIYLKDTRISAPLLTGTEVGKDGCPTGRQHIISLDLISKRTVMVMNNHYGELEEA